MSITSILSIIVSLCMMITGMPAAEDPNAIAARTLTISDVVISYNGDEIELTPELSIGLMTTAASAILDFHMTSDGETLFPVQVGIDADNAVVAAVKGGKSFSISNETLLQLLADAGLDLKNIDIQAMIQASYQQMLLAMDEDERALFEKLCLDLLPTTVDMITYVQDPANADQIEADMQGVVASMRGGAEGVSETIEYDGVEYPVTTYAYTLNYEQIMALMDQIYTSNVKLNEFYESYFEFMNMVIDLENKQAAEGGVVYEDKAEDSEMVSVLKPVQPVAAAPVEAEPAAPAMPNIHSFADLYALAELEMTMECVESVSADGEFSQMEAAIEMAMEGMEEPMVYNIVSVEAGEATEASVNMKMDADGMVLEIGAAALEDETEKAFGMEMSGYEVDGDEIEETLNIAVYAQSAKDAETGAGEYAMGMTMAAVDEGELAFNVEGTSDAKGNTSTDVALEAIADGESVFVGFNLGVSNELFGNKLAGMENTEITVETINLLTGKTEDIQPEAQDAMNALMNDAQAAVLPFMTDAMLLVENESVKTLMSLFSAEGEPVVIEENEAADDEYTIAEVEEETIVDPIDPEDDMDAAADVDSMLEKQFTYIPEGFVLEESDIDQEYGSASYSYYNENGDAIYAYIYANTYPSEAVSYTIAEDGSLQPIDAPVVSIEQDDGTIYAEMETREMNVSLSIYSETLTLEEVSRIIAGLK